MDWAGYGLNLPWNLNVAEASGLMIIMILLLFLLYVISLVIMLQFSHPGAIVENAEHVDFEARFLEEWTVCKIAVFPESLTWLSCIFISIGVSKGWRELAHLHISR